MKTLSSTPGPDASRCRPATGAIAPRAGRAGRVATGLVTRLATRAALGLALVATLSGAPWALERAGLSPIGTARAAQPADPASFGRDLAASCAGCHNTNGRAVGSGLVLAGMPADRLTQLMTEFRDGKRPATVMHQIAKGYTPEQIKLIAAWLAAQSPK